MFWNIRMAIETAILVAVGICIAFVILLMLQWSPLWTEAAAGWAQAIGVVIGIAVAVWVPSRQRATEIQERRDERRHLNEVLARGGLFLVSDVINFLESLIRRATAGHPKSVRADREIDDLIVRIASLESREVDEARLISLHGIRGSVVDACTYLQAGDQNIPLNIAQIEHLNRRIKALKTIQVELNTAVSKFKKDGTYSAP